MIFVHDENTIPLPTTSSADDRSQMQKSMKSLAEGREISLSLKVVRKITKSYGLFVATRYYRDSRGMVGTQEEDVARYRCHRLDSDARATALTRLVRNINTKDSREEEKDDVDHHSCHQHLNQPTVPVNPQAFPIRTPHGNQCIPQRVPIRIFMEVVFQETGRREIEHENDEVKTSGDELEGVAEEEDRSD